MVTAAGAAGVGLVALGRVPWCPAERDAVTQHHAVVRVVADTQRHAGHTDILRELLDGAGGEGPTSVPAADPAWWEEYRGRLERTARVVDGSS